MNLRKNRRLNPRTGPVIIGYLLLGLLVSCLFIYGWSHFALTRTQSQCLPLYIETSAPLIKTVSRNAVRRALGENVDPSDKARVAKAPIYGTLHDLIYKGRTLSQITKRPLEIAGGILFIAFIVGIVQSNRQRRALENGIPLRGSKRMTVKQFNRANRGPGGMELKVYEFDA